MFVDSGVYIVVGIMGVFTVVFLFGAYLWRCRNSRKTAAEKDDLPMDYYSQQIRRHAGTVLPDVEGPPTERGETETGELVKFEAPQLSTDRPK